MDLVYKMEEKYPDESKYVADYDTKKRKCNNYGCDNFSLYFTNNLSYCDKCYHGWKYYDKVTELNYLKEYVNSDPVKLIMALKKERDKIIELENTLEIKEDQIVNLELQLEHETETENEVQYEIDSLNEINEQLEEQIIQLQEMSCDCENPKEPSEEIC